jgi:hypothetical protein
MGIHFLDLELRQLDEGRIGEDDMDGRSASRGEETPGWLLGFFDWWDGMVNGKGDQMDSMDIRRRELEDRFDAIGWGLLFLLFAALALPNGTAEYASAAAVGGLMIGLNLVRIVADVPVRWFSVILGAAILVAGSSALAGFHMDVFVLFFVLAGAVTILGAIVRPKRATAS